jgi:hypothetical protein
LRFECNEMCSRCKEPFSTLNSSKNQLRKPVGKRKCPTCCEQLQTYDDSRELFCEECNEFGHSVKAACLGVYFGPGGFQGEHGDGMFGGEFDPTDQNYKHHDY